MNKIPNEWIVYVQTSRYSHEQVVSNTIVAEVEKVTAKCVYLMHHLGWINRMLKAEMKYILCGDQPEAEALKKRLDKESDMPAVERMQKRAHAATVEARTAQTHARRSLGAAFDKINKEDDE